eukprot:TRINITY_DN113140_c0_g1_i1.p1 TRINITY_DN113140_c0_g1~~TRINITY_DN113140_c0_g1_i1.p1  ORF type:complete len:178 (-),score=31.57 TRINITY_DN113140_c0_g1_i1:72-605(-)
MVVLLRTTALRIAATASRAPNGARLLSSRVGQAANRGRGHRRGEETYPDPRRESFQDRGFAARDRRRAQRYWPPSAAASSAEPALEPLPLPGGRKQVAVVAAKSDVDGYLEAQVAFMTAGGHRLFYLNDEELAELEKLAPRISEYFELWEEKAREASGAEDQQGLELELRQQRLLRD